MTNDIFDRKSEIWCERFKELMKKNGYTQETFLKEYKRRYGGGTQANVSRWLRVGNVMQKDGTNKIIGFPSFETMLNIADFFGVTIGYLTGETDFETFEMEKACQYIGIDEDTGKALQNIVSGKSIRFSKYQLKQIRSTLRYLLIADSFPQFINGLRKYAENVYYKNHSLNHTDEIEQKMKKEVFDLAIQCLDYQCEYDEQYGIIDDFKENNVEPTEELLEVIAMLREAEKQNHSDEISSEKEVKLSEYELQKIYFELIKDVVLDEHLAEMTISRYREDN